MKRMLACLLIACVLLPVARPAEALDFDRRRMLNAAEHVPWRAVGRVNVATQRELSMCTGTLIAEDIVLTAAHCVISHLTGRVLPPGVVHFVAGWRLGQKVAESVAAAIAVHPAYRPGPMVDMDQISSDMALIRLATPIPRAKAPFFQVADPPDHSVPLTLISYRRDRPHALTRQLGCDIREIEGPVLRLGCDVTFGASGSPLFVEENGESRVVAVISSMERGGREPIAYAVLVRPLLQDVMRRLR